MGSLPIGTVDCSQLVWTSDAYGLLGLACSRGCLWHAIVAFHCGLPTWPAIVASHPEASPCRQFPLAVAFHRRLHVRVSHLWLPAVQMQVDRLQFMPGDRMVKFHCAVTKLLSES